MLFPRLRAHLHVLQYRIKHLASSGDNSAQNYGASASRNGSHSDPVVRHYLRLEVLRRAADHVVEEMRPVLDEYLGIKNSSLESEREMFLILERHYWDGEKVEDIAASLGKSARTLYRRKNELLRRVERRNERAE